MARVVITLPMQHHIAALADVWEHLLAREPAQAACCAYNQLSAYVVFHKPYDTPQQYIVCLETSVA